ncbi:MAG: methyl-accepting chemotaxis protein, partial [Candidatus Promineifilaceae bacterium]
QTYLPEYERMSQGRKGRFDKDGGKILGHNIPQATLGAIVLWFGWFGFNGGSTLTVDSTVPFILVNTTMAGAFGGLAALVLKWGLNGKPEVESIINGALAGLVSITASANIISISSSVIIGLVGGLIATGLTILLEQFEIDDAVGAFPVHAGGGVWGTLAVAIFSSQEVLTGMEMTRGGLFSIQLTGIIATFIWAFGLSFLLFWTLNKLIPFRVTEEEEEMGLNVAEHGAKTILFTMLTEMETQRKTGDLSMRVSVEPNTEVGVIAAQYNRVLAQVSQVLTQVQNENNTVQQSIMRLLNEVTSIADGDLTIEAVVSEDATGAVADSFNFMVEELREIIIKVKSGAKQLNQSLNEIQTNADVMTSGAEIQVRQIIDTTAAVDEMNVSIQQVSDNAEESAKVGEQSRIKALRGRQAVRATIEGMDRIKDQVGNTTEYVGNLEERTAEISSLLQMIQDVSERTSILAINASIQAREAGEAGRGFAVVANEVQSLAERSTTTASLVRTSVRSIQSEMKKLTAAIAETNREVVLGSKLADQAGNELLEIENVSVQLAGLIQSISLAAKQQARGSATIAHTMSDISQITQQTSAGTTQTTASLRSLGTLAEDLQAAISRFRVDSSEITLSGLEYDAAMARL